MKFLVKYFLFTEGTGGDGISGENPAEDLHRLKDYDPLEIILSIGLMVFAVWFLSKYRRKIYGK